MAKREEMFYLAKPIGRPKIEIDFSQFEKLCEICCTLREIAGWFRCSEDTIERRCLEHYGEHFAEVFKQFSAPGKIALRHAQMQSAVGGNVTAQIWLGKQILGQKDSPDNSTGNDDSEVITGLADLKRKLAHQPGETLNDNQEDKSRVKVKIRPSENSQETRNHGKQG